MFSCRGGASLAALQSDRDGRAARIVSVLCQAAVAARSVSRLASTRRSVVTSALLFLSVRVLSSIVYF